MIMSFKLVAALASTGLLNFGHCARASESPSKSAGDIILDAARHNARPSKHMGATIIYSKSSARQATGIGAAGGKSASAEAVLVKDRRKQNLTASSFDMPWWLDKHKFDEASFPGLSEAAGRFFMTSDRPLLFETEAHIDRLHATYEDPLKPRAAILILSQQLHCGPSCESPYARNHNTETCTQRTSIANLLKAVSMNFYQRVPDTSYPTVIFHEDFNDGDRALMEAASSAPVFFQKIRIAEETLPAYMQGRSFILSALRVLHPHNNVSLPSQGIHGFGYRQMCRFFAGLVFYAPVLRKFDWFMRLDGGDSRLGPTFVDPFRLLSKHGQVYGFLKYAGYPSPQLEPGFKRFNEKFPDVHWDQGLLEIWRSGQAIYNNFEVVHMASFREPSAWAFFQQFDQDAIFLARFGAPPHNSSWIFDAKVGPTGDADFRTLTLAMVTNSGGIRKFGGGNEVTYSHPVPNWCQEKAKSKSKNYKKSKANEKKRAQDYEAA